MAYNIFGKNNKAVVLENYNKKRIKEQSERKINSYLKEIGKYSAFLEVFDNIRLEEQELPMIETVEDIKTNDYFLEGRRFGFTLIENGFDMEKFIQYRTDREKKKHR